MFDKSDLLTLYPYQHLSPLPRVFARIPNRHPAWKYGSIAEGRAARQRIAAHHAAYWWPRQKFDLFRCSQGVHVKAQALVWQRNGSVRSISTTQATKISTREGRQTDNREGPQVIEDPGGKYSSGANFSAAATSSYRLGRPISPTTYILGADRVGLFVAHALAGLQEPVTLLSHRRSLCERWREEGQVIEVMDEGRSHVRSGIDLKHFPTLASSHGNSKLVIDKLIITARPEFTVRSLLAIRDLLRPSSTICFLQNGMGIIDEVNAEVFPNSAMRPQYMVGVFNHTIRSEPSRISTVFCESHGQTYLSIAPKNMATLLPAEGYAQSADKPHQLVKRMSYGWVSSSRSLMGSLSRAQILRVRAFQYHELLQIQLERLAVNAALGPLSVIFDCANGKLLHNHAVSKLVREILQEIVAVVHDLPELHGVRGIQDRFKLELLENSAFRYAARTRQNTTVMLQDVRRARRTDVDYLNGYFIKRGLELGVACPVNTAVVEMVKARQMMVSREEEIIIPFHGR